MVPFENQVDVPLHDWIMALEIVKIAIIQLVNTIEPRFTIGFRCSRVVSVGDFETGCPGFDPQSRHYSHGGVPLGKAHFLA